MSILPGESVTGTEYIDMSGIDTTQNVELSVYAENQTDKTGCTVTDSVGLSDISISGSSTEKDGKIEVTSTISNKGLKDAQTVVRLFSDESKTDELDQSETITLKPQESKKISFEVNKTAIKYNDKGAAYLTLYAEVSGGDYHEEDNVAYVVLYKEAAGIESGDDKEDDGSNNGNGTTSEKTVKVSQITLSGISKKIAAGKKIKLTAKISPSEASNKELTWKSSNPKVASVDGKGIVTVKKSSGGKKVTITAAAKDGSGVKASYTITSMKGVVKKITLSGISKKIAAGKKIKLTSKITASKNANRTLRWKSGNPKIAAVTSKGVVTMKKGSGGKTVTITASATDGSGKKASYKITSMKGGVKKVTISGKKIKSVKAGNSLQLKTKVTASNAKRANRKLKWTSSNKKYASVNASGKVKTKKTGKGKKVKITAEATDGSGRRTTVTIKIQ